jgi:nicotinate-nucleotide pyrophosphorylase (carboxylating)
MAETAAHLLPQCLVEQAVKAALQEDLGVAGDITTDAIIAADARSEAEMCRPR